MICVAFRSKFGLVVVSQRLRMPKGKTLRASVEGLRLIEAARNKKGWNKQDKVWSDLAEVSRETLKRFQKGDSINEKNFIGICEAIEVSYKDVIAAPRSFWLSSPAVDSLIGRKNDIKTLSNWIEKDKCRLIAIVAFGGTGKSYLTKQLALDLESKFTGVYWVDLRNAPPIEEVFTALIGFLSNQQEIELPKSFDARLLRLLDYLTRNRWLIIFDNGESILESNAGSENYRTDYIQYGQLFEKLAACDHSSTVIVTSREQLPEVKLLAAENAPVRVYKLLGIDIDAVGILRNKGIQGTEAQLQEIIRRYQGNPLGINVAAGAIKEDYGGNIELFLEQNKIVFGRIEDELNKQFQKLSPTEKSLMYWLALNREPITISNLKENLLLDIKTSQVNSVINSLCDRILLQITENGYTLQNVVMEYITQLIIDSTIEEINNNKVEKLNLLDTHCLIQATTSDYIRVCQYNTIIKPILEYFTKRFSPKQLHNRLLKIIAHLRNTNSDKKYGYAPGNIINLLVGLQADLRGINCSGLTIRQAYLQSVALPQVDFSNCHFENSSFAQAMGSILTVTFNPDQTLLAAAGTDGYIRIWRIADGRDIAAWKAHDDWIRVLTFNDDGSLLASGSNDKIINVWQWENQELQNRLVGHTDWIWSLKFAKKHNLDLLISTSSDNTARIWNLATSQTIDIYDNLKELAGVVWSVAFSPDGKTFASGSAATVQLWNIETKDWIRDVPDGGTRVRALCFSPDGQLLAGSNDRQEIVVWHVATGEYKEILPVAPTAAIWSLQYTPDGSKLISCGTDAIQIWDMVNYQPLMTLKEPHHRIRSIAYSEMNNLLAVGSDDQLVRIWDTAKGESIRSFHSHNNRIWTMALGKVNNCPVLASGGDDGKIRLWDGKTGENINTISGHEGKIRILAFSPDNRFLASAGSDRTIKVWDLHNLYQPPMTYRKHTDLVWKVLFFDGGNSLISLSDDKTILKFTLQGGCTEAFPLSQQEWMWTAAINPQENILALAGDNLTVDLWDIVTKTKVISFKGHQQRIKAITFNSTGELVISASDDNTIKIWHIKSKKCWQTINNSLRETRSLITIPADKTRPELIASSGDDCVIRIYDLTSNKLAVLEGHTRSIWSLAYCADSDYLYSCGEDETIKIWHLATEKCLKTLKIPQLYQGMNLTNSTGLNEVSIQSLFTLGAVEFKIEC